MPLERRVKLFPIGADQVVEIPLESELPTDEVSIRKQGDRLIIEPSFPIPPVLETSTDRLPNKNARAWAALSVGATI